MLNNQRRVTVIVLAIIIMLANAGFLHAQSYTARLADALDNSPIAYANIGIPGSTNGTNSDEDGKFILDIPSSLSNKTLVISLIGYEEIKMPVKEFITRVNKGDTVIKLYKKMYSLDEVVIKPTKLKQARLGNFIKCDGSMLPLPYVIETKKRKNKIKVKRSDTLTEVGTLMKVKGKTTYIDSVSINVGSCTYPEILFRLNIYELVDGQQKNILKEPIYIRKKRSEVGSILMVDLTEKNFVVNNNFIVSIETVKELGKGEFAVCAGLLGSQSYMRIASIQADFIKLPIFSFGIAAYVTYSVPEK